MASSPSTSSSRWAIDQVTVTLRSSAISAVLTSAIWKSLKRSLSQSFQAWAVCASSFCQWSRSTARRPVSRRVPVPARRPLASSARSISARRRFWSNGVSGSTTLWAPIEISAGVPS